MIIVADSSPLIALMRVGRLELLRELYGTIIMPDAVWNELVVAGAQRPGADLVTQCGWIVRKPVGNRAMVDAMSELLDPGEREAIVLAQEIDADALLMDESIGRAAAMHLGLKVTGLIGVLLRAKNIGLLPDAVELAQEMRNQGWWVADKLLEMLR
ncbi:MAG: DUF3368 domain-containing protein [Prosthecobacter sp.]|uniref:DUF3368 domain-containing protein n=1 Tax=Prosthecobacter sp. TaxID=1965333 RepID=UPI0039012E59